VSFLHKDWTQAHSIRATAWRFFGEFARAGTQIQISGKIGTMTLQLDLHRSILF
jgi:hypothetical protein